MSHTLDDLLDATGLSDLEAEGFEKRAAEAAPTEEHEQFLKLAERCERAATQTSPLSSSGRERELAEKTAAIEVIAQTLGEIDAVVAGGEKVAADRRPAAAFIERALASGHAPAEIARFMKAAGLLSRSAHSLMGRAGVSAADTLHNAGVRHFGAALRDAAENMAPARLERYIQGLRASYGDKKVRHLIERSGANVGHVPSARALFPSDPSPPATATSQLKSVAKPAATAAAGLAAGKLLFDRDGGGDKRHGGGGVTVIR